MKREYVKPHHFFLIFLYLFWVIIEAMLSKLNLISCNRLRVLLYHDIPPHLYLNFEKQLRHISKKWNFVTPEIFNEMIVGNIPIKGNNILLTFDDGFMSNKVIVNNILEKLNIKALFFIIPNFADIKNKLVADKFIVEKIFPGIEDVTLNESITNMKWDDLRYLIKCGHTIGSHTLNHARLSDISDDFILKDEIIKSSELLKERLGIQIDHFAFPFGNFSSINKKSVNIIKNNYKFLHTGLRGNNPINSFIILRDAIQPSDSKLLVMTFLSGVADFHYSKFVKKLIKW